MKKIAIGILIILLGLITWYLFLKKYDYVITFKANLAPLGVYHQVKRIESKINIEIATIDNTYLEQEIIINDEAVILDWHFESVKDTITKIKVGIISKEHSIQNRLKIITGSSSIVELVKEDLVDYRNELIRYTNTFKVIVNGETELPPMETLSVSSRVKRDSKAQEMMSQNGYLYPKLLDSKVQRNGYPFVKINNWNLETDNIEMDFGFPVTYKDSLPVNSKIVYTKRNSQKALKATYYGNYRNSDEAWFVLLQYAASNNILVKKEPLEVFYNDPMLDGNELQWKAEIFLPIENR
ncbi:hypothetical protein [Aquimarina celericrescens]|uniref:Effector-binding domain-containing protein n=1 Tax=Aquimarina celericrescens TaxID=1964542 RepID=A0ABW5AX77_9FLAO|nr:hypothetical protein [Aquimarina celericrescens]